MSADAELQQLAEGIRQVRMAYDRYFLGIDRLEPHKERDATQKLLARLLGETQRNTAQKFRLQTLQASWVSYLSYWNRIARQIEEGTFKRDKLRAAQQGGQPAETPTLQAAAPTQAPLAASASLGPDAGAAGPTTEATILALHAELERTRTALGLPASGTTVASLAATVQRQAAAIKAQYHCDDVAFRVAIKDGKPILKATPR